MIQRGRSGRLDAVAKAYLQAEAPRSRLVVVAGEEAQSTDDAVRCLQHAAAGLEMPTVLLHRGSESVDLELGRDQVAPLVVYDHGPASESQLVHLKPARPHDLGPDLLLWDLPRRRDVGLRSIYLLALWSWAFHPRQVRCLLPPASDEDPPLTAIRQRVSERIESCECEVRPEVLQRPDAWSTPATEGLLAQILQSMLASSRRPGTRGPHGSGTRKARAWGWAVALVLSLALPCSASAQSAAAAEDTTSRAALVTFEIEGVRLDDGSILKGVDGSRVSSGSHHLLRLRPGVGSSTPEGLTLTTPRSELVAREGTAELEWTARARSIEEALVFESVDFTLQVRRGRYTIGPTSVVVELPEEAASVLPGREGLILTGVILVLIVLLFWRASATRRRLDEPYESLRRRRGSTS